MKELEQELQDISIRGKMAFMVKCFENYASSKYPELDWGQLFQFMRKVTSVEWIDDDWWYPLGEFLPEFILETTGYDKDQYESLSEKDYIYYKNLFSGVKRDIVKILSNIHDLLSIYLYGDIDDHGKEMNVAMCKIIKDMTKSKAFVLPDINKYKFSKWEERDGWGNRFDFDFDI